MAVRKNMTDYPTYIGDKKASCIVHNGPASYVQVVVASPPTGGDLVSVAELGLKAIDWGQGMGSDDGQFDVVVFSDNGNPVSSFGGLPCKNLRLMWLVAATGAQVGGGVNLSARSVKLFVVGPK